MQWLLYILITTGPVPATVVVPMPTSAACEAEAGKLPAGYHGICGAMPVGRAA